MSTSAAGAGLNELTVAVRGENGEEEFMGISQVCSWAFHRYVHRPFDVSHCNVRKIIPSPARRPPIVLYCIVKVI